MNHRLRPQCLEQDIRYALYHGQSIIDHDQYEKVEARRRARGAIDGEQNNCINIFLWDSPSGHWWRRVSAHILRPINFSYWRGTINETLDIARESLSKVVMWTGIGLTFEKLQLAMAKLDSNGIEIIVHYCSCTWWSFLTHADSLSCDLKISALY